MMVSHHSDFEQGSEVTKFILVEDHSGCYVENRLYGARVETRSVGRLLKWLIQARDDGGMD